MMWNFVESNDIQGRYDSQDGNWMSGIKFMDELHLGSQDNLPADVLKTRDVTPIISFHSF
jgi:hypothetical protein